MGSIRVIHMADLHFSGNKDMLAEVNRCSSFAGRYVEEQKPDAVVIAGDLFDHRLLLDDRGALEAQAFVRRLAAVCPVLIVRGTDLHDFDSLEMLRGLPYSVIVNAAGQLHFKKGRGFYTPDASLPDAVVTCLPSPPKEVFSSTGQTTHKAEEEVVSVLRSNLREWGGINKTMREKGVATLAVGHGTVEGAVSSTGYVMVGHDLTYGKADLEALHADYIAFGHIHKAQKAGPAWYSGSIGRLNSGETEHKGFYDVTITAAEKATPVFIKTPARKYILIDLGQDPDEWKERVQEQMAEAGANDVVRIDLSLSEANATAITRADIESLVGSQVILNKTIIPIQRDQTTGISLLSSDIDKFAKWLESAGLEADEGLLVRAGMLHMGKDDLISAVLASIDGVESALVSPAVSHGDADSVQLSQSAKIVKKRKPRKRKADTVEQDQTLLGIAEG